MPNNQKQPNSGRDMQDRNKQGQFTDDRNRKASDRGNIDYQKNSDLGRQGSGSQSSKHMSDIGRKGGQH